MAVRTIARSLVVLLLSLVVPAINLTQTIIADRIVIEKSARTMKLMRHGEILKTYKVALSRVPAGAKERTGDHKVPEGEYIVNSKNAQSRFHRALHISYPNATDRERARKLGVAPGGDIEIHGLNTTYSWVGGLQRQVDWTDGCIAVTNPEIEAIFSLVPVGTPVEIRP
jgi:murein L,D-transpeptidase YafK